VTSSGGPDGSDGSGGLERSLRDDGFRGALRSEHPLSGLTTWRIGGPAELLAEPRDRDDVRVALRWAARVGVPWRVLGNGSNLLVRDEGVRGLVLRVRRVLDEIRIDGPRIVAGAGASFPAVARRAAERGLAGLEFAAGIPGTVGGAVVMNAGWHRFETGPLVTRVEFVARDGEPSSLPRDACGFRYRGSLFRDRPGVVLQADFELTVDDPKAVRARMDEFAESRKLNQPTELPSCGSVFLKPTDDFAGRLIEQAGLKGLRVGDLEVSTKHANFIVNRGGGSAADALELIERVERAVYERFGVRLVREFELWE
jgi:UDP-N-acetylmuramate dehydrogenase